MEYVVGRLSQQIDESRFDLVKADLTFSLRSYFENALAVGGQLDREDLVKIREETKFSIQDDREYLACLVFDESLNGCAHSFGEVLQSMHCGQLRLLVWRLYRIADQLENDWKDFQQTVLKLLHKVSRCQDVHQSSSHRI